MFHFSFFFFVFFSLHQDEPDEAVNRGSICSRISLQHLYKVFGHHLLHMHSHTYEGRMKKVLCVCCCFFFFVLFSFKDVGVSHQLVHSISFYNSLAHLVVVTQMKFKFSRLFHVLASMVTNREVLHLVYDLIDNSFLVARTCDYVFVI